MQMNKFKNATQIKKIQKYLNSGEIKYNQLNVNEKFGLLEVQKSTVKTIEFVEQNTPPNTRFNTHECCNTGQLLNTDRKLTNYPMSPYFGNKKSTQRVIHPKILNQKLQNHDRSISKIRQSSVQYSDANSRLSQKSKVVHFCTDDIVTSRRRSQRDKLSSQSRNSKRPKKINSKSFVFPNKSMAAQSPETHEISKPMNPIPIIAELAKSKI